MPHSTIEIFISYSKQDKELRDGLLAHLRPLKTQGIITWHDRQILPGTQWDDEIRAHLNAADIILLLLSSDFLNTDYCTQVEIPEALRRHEAGEATVMPVILRSCGWQYTPLAAIQAYPERAKPIKSWADIDEAYTNVVDAVYLAATEIRGRRDLEGQQAEPARPLDPSPILRRELQECDSAKIRFIKNVKAPEWWAYSLDRMDHPESRSFELMWMASSHGYDLPKAGDLMILHQRAKVTHVIEFLDDQARQMNSGFFRWVRAVWIAEQDWNQLPHQREILGFNPNYTGGSTHSFSSPDFSTFRAAWSNLEEFQRYIIKRLTGGNVFTSEKGIDYRNLQNLLKEGKWREADEETLRVMLKAANRESEGWLDENSLKEFPCTDLQTIDHLWIAASKGHFGFSVQKKIWEECGSPMDYSAEWKTLVAHIGWRKNEEWLDYNDLQFNLASSSAGELPRLVLSGSHLLRWGAIALLSRNDL